MGVARDGIEPPTRGQKTQRQELIRSEQTPRKSRTWEKDVGTGYHRLLPEVGTFLERFSDVFQLQASSFGWNFVAALVSFGRYKFGRPILWRRTPERERLLLEAMHDDGSS